MGEERNLEKEIKELKILAIEDYGVASLESTFIALDAIREYERLHPYTEKQEEAGETANNNTGS